MTVKEKTIHSIIGPNGAGKTTLFNLLSGVYIPTSGIIIFRGQDITSLKLFERSKVGLGRSYQITSIFPELTVRENIRLAAQSKGKRNFNILRKASNLKEVEKETDNILQEMKLNDLAKQKAGTIPYGRQRTLDVAIALATNPILLMLDEPTSGMTPEDTHKMIDLIKKIAENRTIILIEHHMNLVMAISDKISVLHYGKIISEGTPEFVQKDEQVQKAYLGGANSNKD
ncbi:MAG: ABC transporter ATP-binding protein [Smithella sp.]|nr:ABC transporter ATP-binding protein [Smithella sp.]